MMRKSERQQPRVVTDWEQNNGFLDSLGFKAYCLALQRCIESLDRPTIADQKRAMGESFVERYHADALDSLMSIRSIRQITSVSPLRWSAGDRDVKPLQSRFNNRQVQG